MLAFNVKKKATVTINVDYISLNEHKGPIGSFAQYRYVVLVSWL